MTDNSVGTAEIANGAVLNSKIADNAVTGAKILDGTVGTLDIADGAVTAAKLTNGAVVAGKIAAGAVGGNEIANTAVSNAKIADAAVNSAKIADASIGATDIAPNAVGTNQIAPAAVTRAKLAADVGAPVAFGIVNAGGGCAASTANVTACNRIDDGEYEVVFNDQTYTTTTHVAMVTPVVTGNNGVAMVATAANSGRLVVHFRTSSGTSGNTDRMFHFVVYRAPTP
jgi:hypothetical protein